MDELIVKCPHCKKKTSVTARCVKLHNMETGIVYDEENGIPYLDYENVDIEADWEYVCEKCGKKLANNIDDLMEL
jgi:DNA-directed RNA polymerase subunit RPC12/RpoP